MANFRVLTIGTNGFTPTTFMEGTGVSFTQGSGTITIGLTGAGTGDVDGPASSTDNAVARFDGTTGKLIQNSAVTIDDTGLLEASALAGLQVYAADYVAMEDTDASHHLRIECGEDLTASDKTLSIILNNANRTLTISGNATISGTHTGTSSGTNTGDQTITLTGDVTGSGTGSFAATIANDAVTYAKMQNVSATDRILGRSTAGAGDVEEITCTATGRSILDDASFGAVRTTIGGTTVGQNYFTLTNPSAVTFPRMNADNTVDALSASDFRTAIGAGTGGGDVVGPGSATDNAVARFDSTTGKLIQNSVVTVGDTGNVAGVAALTASGLVSTTAALQARTAVQIVDNGGTGSYYLSIVANDTMTAVRQLALNMNNVNRAITFGGDLTVVAPGATVSNTNTGDQTITLTGDVTGSGTGSFAATIANDAVTYAKMQNVSAASRVLGRKTAGAGDTEECTLSEVLDFIGSAAQGDILYRGASAWARLAAGTGGNVLTTNGAGANPSWSAAGTGTVTSVGLSFSGASFITVSGSPVTGSGTLTGTWTGALGDVLYASAADTWSKLTGNTTTTRNFLRQVGDGLASAAPAWDTVTKTDVGLSDVENTALSTWAGSANITMLGTIASGQFANTALKVLDTNASHTLTFKPGSDLAANRTLTITTGDADRTLDISAGSVTISAYGASLVDDADAPTARGTLGLGTSAVIDTGTSGTKVPLLDGANTWSAAQTFINSSGVKIQDTDASHTLGIVGGSNLTSNRTLTITTGDANRTVTLSGDTTLSGTNTGDVSMASQSQQEAGTDTTVTVNPGVQHYHPSAAKAWVNFTGTGTVTVNASYNNSSITDNGTGDYTVNHSTAFSSANYGFSGCCGRNGTGSGGYFLTGPSSSAVTSSAFRLATTDNLGVGTDTARVGVTFFGDQ